MKRDAYDRFPQGQIARLLTGACCFVVAGDDSSGRAAVAVPAEATQQRVASSVALALGQGSPAPSPVAEIALAKSLSSFPDVQLAERKASQGVLKEQKLNAGGLVDPATAIRIGELASADAFVLIEKGPYSKPAIIRVRVIETRTGIRLLDRLLPEGGTLRAGIHRRQVTSGTDLVLRASSGRVPMRLCPRSVGATRLAA